jgi:uncharacterized protein (DUF486 family)
LRIFPVPARAGTPMTPPSTIVTTALLLAASNLFMTFAWYGHLKHLRASPWMVAALVSWGIAFFEYLIQVPANRIGFSGGLTLAQLKLMQEVITLAVFVPFAIFYMGEGLRWNYLWAGLCLVAAVYFIFQ